jgi:hypothetical protein
MHFSLPAKLCKGNNISQHDKQELMGLVKKLVYSKSEKSLTDESLVKTYKNFVEHMEKNWMRR